MSILKNKLTPADLSEMVLYHEFLRPGVGTLTVCVIKLKNGCELVGTSNVIDPANYDRDLGETAAYNNTVNQLWEREGYALKRDAKLLVERAARAAHEANRLYCRTIGDDSQVAWEDAPEWQRGSARMGVAAICADPNQAPDANHNSWLKEKVKEGWVYGPVKDAKLKQHPCMVSFEELPEAQRYKDELFIATVKSVLDPL